jgi:hypothetical protein
LAQKNREKYTSEIPESWGERLELIRDPRERGAHHSCKLPSLNLPPTRKRGGRGRARGAGRDERVSSGFGVVFSVGVYSPFGRVFLLFLCCGWCKAATCI